jgi:hypothetical protein
MNFKFDAAYSLEKALVTRWWGRGQRYGGYLQITENY